MTISFGWSLDLTGTSRRLAGILTVGFLGAALVLPGSALAAGPYDPVTDVNSMYNTTTYTGVRAWWAAGYTGAGVDVAVIDTGVSPVEGLATAGKIIYGPDLCDRHGRLPRRGPRRADRQPQGRRRRRGRGRLPGHRRDRLGRPAQDRQRDEHPGPQPGLWERQRAGLRGRPALVRGRAGVEGRHLRRHGHRQCRLRIQERDAHESGV